MTLGTSLFRATLIAGWLALFYVSFHAVQAAGFNGAGAAFFAGFSQPWPAQFNLDFGLHLLLAAAWFVWRSKNRLIGLVFGILAINLGALFTIGFLLVASIQAKGDIKKVLLGARA